MAKGAATTVESVTLPEVYKSFENKFLIEHAGHLSPHKNHDHINNFVEGAQPLYRLIFVISENELFTLRAYIVKNLANKFIKPSKSLAKDPIFFVRKRNRDFWLYVDCWGLNNLIIKNCYSFSLLGESQGGLDFTNQYTKLNLTDAHYQMGIKKSNK